MQNNRFVVLTGHLSNYPLSDLVGILRHQRKSGRLLIEYPKGPATFFFQNGELIDARMNDLIGLQAICVALAQPEASFNFNPLIQSPRRSIDPSLQRAVSELFGCWDESALQIESAAYSGSRPLRHAAGSASRTLSGRRSELLALPPGPSSLVQRRSVILIAAAVVIVVGLSTVIAVTGGFKDNQLAATPLQQTQTQSAPVAAPAEVPNSQRVAAAVKPNRPKTRTQGREAKAVGSRLTGRRCNRNSHRAGDQGRDADREWASVESVNRESQTRNGQLRSNGAANRAAASLSGDVNWW